MLGDHEPPMKVVLYNHHYDLPQRIQLVISQVCPAHRSAIRLFIAASEAAVFRFFVHGGHEFLKEVTLQPQTQGKYEFLSECALG